ncbi:MAG: T9SS type A sorting domain-containing protein [Bacteroidota bacterium]|nr:T9SS type A sorting domain-containing protein [Bacteroidota bacterium]
MNFQKKYFFFSTLFGFILFVFPLKAQTLYWLDASFSSPVIGKSAVDGSNIQTTPLIGSSLPEALTYSTSDSKILWTELKFSDGSIYDTDTSFAAASQLLSNTSVVRGVAVDIDSNWIYYATSNLQTKPKINRMHLNGTGNETVLVLDSITGNPRALALDAATRHLYWTEFTEGTIKRIDLDDSAAPQIIVSGLNGPVGLAVDHSGGNIYWTEANANTISRSPLNGFVKVVILSSLATPNYLTVDTAGGFVYWTEISTPRIRKATVAGNSVETLPITVSHPTGIRFVSENEAALPVELTAFTVSAMDNAATLTWKTATETNNYGFEVERKYIGHPEQANEMSASKDASTPSPKNSSVAQHEWSSVGFVEGSGTTNAPKEYSYTDKNLSTGKYSYRLKQIDRDGKFSYTQEVEVTIGTMLKEFALMQNYPNPFNPSTTISYQIPVKSNVSLKVYDAIGREVAALVNGVKEAGSYSTTFKGAKHSSGIYFARLQSGDKAVFKKMILLK